MHTSRGLLFLTSLLLKSFTVCLGLRSCEFNSTTILGAGASYPALYYQDIGTLFANNRSQFLQYPVAFQYERVNSGYGLQRVMGEIEKMPPVNFGAGQTPMNDSETHLHTNLITFPTLAG